LDDKSGVLQVVAVFIAIKQLMPIQVLVLPDLCRYKYRRYQIYADTSIGAIRFMPIQVLVLPDLVDAK
jgi:hypothetical protein